MAGARNDNGGGREEVCHYDIKILRDDVPQNDNRGVHSLRGEPYVYLIILKSNKKGMIIQMVYFDNAASTLIKPRCVARAVCEAINEYGANPGRSGHKISLKAANIVYNTRCKLAAFFNAEPENVIFTNNATTALNLAILGLDLKNAHVITTDIEHNSVIRPLYSLEGVQIEHVCTDINDDIFISRLKAAIRPTTKLIVLTYASNVIGVKLPIEKIGALANQNNIIFILDGVQGAGYDEIDMQKMNIDFLCITGHKGLYGPQGIGALIINTDTPLKPLVYGGTGTNSSDTAMPLLAPERYESGTVNTPGIAGLGAGIDYINTVGIKNINCKCSSLTQMTLEGLSVCKGINIYTPKNIAVAPIIAFNTQKSPSETGEYLDNAGICIRTGIHCAPLVHKKIGQPFGTVRISFSSFNTKNEVNFLLNIINNFNK